LIRLFTTAFPERKPPRRAEYAECLLRNIGCREIDEVCVLAEGDVELPASGKLVVRRIERRPRFADYFRWIEEVAGPADVSLVANADIYFDSQIGVLRLGTFPPRIVLALSRWDVSARATPTLNDRNDSQDTWAFRGTPGGIVGDFPIGVPRCDNRLVKELELAGYRVVNPAFSLRSYHLHAGAREGYTVEHVGGFVYPPYGYVWPHNLLPFHHTLWHNARNREHRLAWRLDRRYWRRVLKFHWFQKGFGVLSRPFRHTVNGS
jgi:hypothetical protein